MFTSIFFYIISATNVRKSVSIALLFGQYLCIVAGMVEEYKMSLWLRPAYLYSITKRNYQGVWIQVKRVFESFSIENI